MNAALILAGGGGTRFGGSIPKQYIEVLGKPVLAYAMENYEKSPLIDAIQVVCKDEYRDKVWQMAKDYGITKLKWVDTSGAECQDSIRCGVYAMRDRLQDDDILLMAMGVSPMIAQESIGEAIRLAEEKGCSFTMFPITIVMAHKVAENWTDRNAYKEDYIELNAPWTFRYGEVYDLYREADRLNKGKSVKDYTLNLWLEMGHKAWYYRGSDIGRMKITTPFDLELFKAYLMVQKMQAEASQGDPAPEPEKQ